MYGHAPNYPNKQAVALAAINEVFEHRLPGAFELELKIYTTLICVTLSKNTMGKYEKRSFEVDLQQGGVGVNRDQAAHKMAKALKELGGRK